MRRSAQWSQTPRPSTCRTGAKPRYTGRQIWNRQRTNHNETVPGDKRTSPGPTRAWNPRSERITSSHRTHPALISDTDFLAAQHITAIGHPSRPYMAMLHIQDHQDRRSSPMFACVPRRSSPLTCANSPAPAFFLVPQRDASTFVETPTTEGDV